MNRPFVARSFFRRTPNSRAPPPKPAPRRSPQKRKPANDVLCDVRDTITRALKETHFLCTLLIAAALLYAHADDIDSGPLAPLFPKDSTNQLVKWIRANVQKFFGLIAFAPAMVGVPHQHRMLTIVSATLWVLFIPESTVYQYCVQALLLLLVFKVRLDSSRWTIVGIAALAFFGGWLIAEKPKATTDNSTNPRPKRSTLAPNIVHGQNADAQISQEIYANAVLAGLLPKERKDCKPFPLTWSWEGDHCQCATGYILTNSPPPPGLSSTNACKKINPCGPSMEMSNGLCRCADGKHWNSLDPYNPFCL